MIGQCHRSLSASVYQVGCCEREWINRCIWHTHSTYNQGVHRRLNDARLGRVDNLGINASTDTGINKGGLIIQIILRQSDKKAIGLLHTVTGDVSQYHVLGNAFGCTLLVGHSITRSAVHKSVIAACGAIGHVKALYKQHSQSAQCTIACCASTSNATTYYNYVKFSI